MPKSESYDSFFIQMGYRTLYIRDSEKLRLYLDNIVVDTGKEELRFLISDLKFLIIDNYKTTLSSQLINRLADNNVSLVICDMSHLPNCQLISLNGHYASSGMLFEQISWNDSMKSMIHREIVREKIQSQIYVLIKNKKSQAVVDRLRVFRNEVEEGDITNREGLAAKMYFREMFGNDFIRFDTDIINAGLNYGYAIFRSLISTIIVSKGLLTSIGIFHKGKTNNFNLSDDIIEVYRPIVDDWVLNNLINKELLLNEDKEALIALVDNKIKFDNQLFAINKTVELYLDSIVRCFETNEIKGLILPSLKNINDL